jgi:hypothetical protein
MSPTDHREAVRLGWKSHHIPVLTILAGSWAVAGVLSAVLSIIAQSRVNPY